MHLLSDNNCRFYSFETYYIPQKRQKLSKIEGGMKLNNTKKKACEKEKLDHSGKTKTLTA